MMEKEDNRTDMNEEPLFTIGTIAKMFGLHQQTLRDYEREGLLSPSRTEGGTRMYSQQDVEHLRFILLLTRDMGVNLAGVEVVLRMQDQIYEMTRLMHAVLAQIDEPMRQRVLSFLEGTEFGLVRASHPGEGLAVRRRIHIGSRGPEDEDEGHSEEKATK
jgi:MerR family transcriptional regulator/heat shock protein HspR